MIKNISKEKAWDKRLTWAIGVACLLFLLIQHQAVFMHFDDFGYGCLNYGYNGNEHGMAWTIGDLFQFMKYQYLSWGGRVLFLTFLTLALRIGEQFLQIFQALIIWGIWLCIYGLIKRKENDWVAAALSVLVFGSIGRVVMVDGFFWYTASCLYVWPFLAFFGAILLLGKTSNPKGEKSAAIMILTFIASFSQEQVAVLVVVTLVGDILLKLLLHERINQQLFLTAAVGMFGALIVIFAPGNFVRLSAYPEFSSLNILEKMMINTPRIFLKMFDCTNSIAIVLWLVVLQFLGFSLSKKYKKTIAIYLKYINPLCSIVFFVSWIFCHSLQFKLCMIYLILGLVVTETFFYYLIRKNTLYLALLAGAICSLGMMILAPSFEGRSAIPFFVVVNLLEVSILREELLHARYPRAVQIVTFSLCMASTINLLYFTNGLYRNREVNLINHTKLLEAGRLTDLGEDISSVLLYRVPDDRFTVTMPYWPEAERINVWIRHYYGIPEETELIYRSYEYSNSEDVFRLSVLILDADLRTKGYFIADAIGNVDYAKYDCAERTIQVYGWGTIPGADSAKNEIYFFLDDEIHRIYYKLACNLERIDIADALGDSKQRYSGFSISSVLPKDFTITENVKVGFCVVNRELKWVGELTSGTFETVFQ